MERREVVIDISLNDLDEISLGFYMLKGYDEIGEFKSFNIGFIIFEISIYFY